MKRKGQITQALIPALIVPIILILSVAVYTNFQSTADYVYATTYTNETITVTANISTALENTPIDSISEIWNTTSNTREADFSYNEDSGVLTNKNTTTTGTYNVTYVGHGGDGWSAFENINTGVFNGYQLASLLPYIIVAVIVLGIIVGLTAF